MDIIEDSKMRNEIYRNTAYYSYKNEKIGQRTSHSGLYICPEMSLPKTKGKRKQPDGISSSQRHLGQYLCKMPSQQRYLISCLSPIFFFTARYRVRGLHLYPL